VKNPPKVSYTCAVTRFPQHSYPVGRRRLQYGLRNMQIIFEDQHGHRVAHNPGTLKKV
jgi:hypothetical protein